MRATLTKRSSGKLSASASNDSTGWSELVPGSKALRYGVTHSTPRTSRSTPPPLRGGLQRLDIVALPPVLTLTLPPHLLEELRVLVRYIQYQRSLFRVTRTLDPPYTCDSRLGSGHHHHVRLLLVQPFIGHRVAAENHRLGELRLALRLLGGSTKEPQIFLQSRRRG